MLFVLLIAIMAPQDTEGTCSPIGVSVECDKGGILGGLLCVDCQCKTSTEGQCILEALQTSNLCPIEKCKKCEATICVVSYEFSTTEFFFPSRMSKDKLMPACDVITRGIAFGFYQMKCFRIINNNHMSLECCF